MVTMDANFDENVFRRVRSCSDVFVGTNKRLFSNESGYCGGGEDVSVRKSLKSLCKLVQVATIFNETLKFLCDLRPILVGLEDLGGIFF